jgi:hypothetical protein
MAFTCAIFKWMMPGERKRYMPGNHVPVLAPFIALYVMWIAAAPVLSAHKAIRQICFPATDVGKFVYRSGSMQHVTRALGLVTIPADADRRTLMVNYDASENLEFLNSLGPDDLQRIYLSNTAVTDKQFRILFHFPHLELVALGYTNIGDAGVKQLMQLKSLEEIDLINTLITDVSLSYIAQMPNLRRVSFARTKITEKGLACLAHLKLVKLRVDGDDVGDRGLEMLHRMPIKELSLNGTRITDAGIKKLSGMPTLQGLYIKYDDKVTDASVDSITKMRNLVRFEYGFTGITPQGIARIKHVLKNCHVYI